MLLERLAGDIHHPSDHAIYSSLIYFSLIQKNNNANITKLTSGDTIRHVQS